MSEQISGLERLLSCSLFLRTSRSVELTDAGRQLLPLADEAVLAMDAVVTWAEELDAGPELRVGLVVSHPGSRRILATAAERMTDVSWQIRQLDFSGCHQALVRGEVDCAFTMEIGATVPAGVEALPLWEEGCVVVLADGHRWADRTSVTLEEIAGEVFISAEDRASSARWLAAILAPVGAAPKVLPVARGVEEMLELVGAGMGINIAGASAPAMYARPGLRFVPVIDAPTITTYLCLRRGRPSASLEEFARLAVATAHAVP